MKKSKDSLYSYLLISLGLHLVVFVFLTVKILFFPSETPDFQQAMRVDVVALPEKNLEPPKPVAKAPEPVKKAEPKPKPKKQNKPKPPKPKVAKKPKLPNPKKVVKKEKIDDKKVQEEQDSALARLKALKKLKDKNKKDGADKNVEFKGNQLSKGNSLSGLAKLHHEDYLDQLDGHIRNFWNLPEWLANGNLRASVLLLINKNGGILGKSFVQKSGNDLFDEHVMSTIEKASPLPAPPPSLVDFYATKGVEIRFPE